jgi:flagellar motor protein MotB
MRGIGMVVGALCAAVALSGCASSKRTKERMAVLDAENTDLRQANDQMNAQLQQSQAESDRLAAQMQQAEARRVELEKVAMANAAAAGQLQRADAELMALRAQNEEQNRKIAALSAAPKTPINTYAANAPALDAFRRDLQNRLGSYSVKGVDVDVRTAQDGQQRVAVVLQNSFRAGSASLAQNMTATKAVVGLGKLIADSYPGSRVVVEGHTDSDKITKSKWESNEALSLARSEEVKKLLRQSGVADARVSAVGMGARQPIARGSTDRAKAQNRRVEIYIYPTASN